MTRVMKKYTKFPIDILWIGTEDFYINNNI